jgi:probable addiction module antidote protein
VVEYLNAVLAEDDTAALTQALGTVARSQGMTSIAEKAGLKREGHYKSFDEGGN